jgi:hypothetical protein
MAFLVSKPALTDADIMGSNNYLSVITTAGALQIGGLYPYPINTASTPSPTFVGAGETVTAIGIHIGGWSGAPGLTVSLNVQNATDGVGNETFTYPASLLAGARGWCFFSLGEGGKVFTAGKAWRWQLVINSAVGNLWVMRGNGSGEWDRIYVTNTEVTPTSADILYLGGRLIPNPVGILQPISMTINNSTSLAGLYINNGASLRWTANNLTLTNSGSISVNPGSEFTIGTPEAPVNGSIDFVNGTSFGLNAFTAYGPCTFNIYGADVSSNYVIDLASTANSGQANAVLASAPDWVAGQEVAYTSSRASNASEVRTVSSVSSNTVTSTTNFTNIHDVRTVGTYSPVPDVAKACLMNRGFVFRNAAGSTGSWYGNLFGPVTCNWDNVFFRDIGANFGATSTATSRNGWIVDITAGGSFIIDNCSFYPSTQLNVACIISENNNSRLSTDYTITNCLYVSRVANNAFLVINGALGANTTVSGCIAICTTLNSAGYAFYTRATSSGNMNISNCFAYGFPAFISRNESSATGVGAITVDSCLSVGAGFYAAANVYSSAAFVLNSTTISNCIAINRILTNAQAAVIFSGITSVAHTISACKFIGFYRYYYNAGSLEAGTIFNDCVFEDDTIASGTQILVGAAGRSNAAFKGCYFSTNFANQSFIVLNWTNLPLYSEGKFYFKDCSFNGDGGQFVATTSLKYFAGFAATLENCTFRTGGTTLNRNYVKMGTATVSTDTFSGTGKSIALTPYSINEATYPFRHQFLLPTTATSVTINFKTKSYGLNGTVKAYVENTFGVVAQSTLTVSSGWDSQSITVTGLTAYTEILNLTIELTGTSGYLVVDDVEVTNASGIISDGGKYAFLNLTSGGGPSETSHLFC